MSDLTIGGTALSVNQQLLDLTGQNIANANTPGYHVQAATLAPLTSGGPGGNGVEITDITRQISTVLDQALNAGTSSLQNLTAQLNVLRQVQSQLSPGSGSLSDLLTTFFSQAQQLSSNPADLTQRRVVLGAAQSLTQGLNSLGGDMSQSQQSLDSQGQEAVASANNLIAQIAALNGVIQNASVQGASVNNLEDQRDQLISQLASTIDVQTNRQAHGVVNVVAGGEPVVMGTQALQLQYNVEPATKVPTVTVVGSSTAADLSGGLLAGILTARTQVLPQLQSELNAFTQSLVSNLDEVQGTGVPLSGSFTVLSGHRSVNDPAVALSGAGLAFPPQAGTLSVTVIDQATGATGLTQIPIDPAHQSLDDVAAAISGVPRLQAVVDTQTNTLSVLAQPGYTFNFSGQLPSTPPTVAITGTAVPKLGGSYTGTINDHYIFSVVGSGTIGVTPNLSLQVSNSAGNLLGTFNIGQGYGPGTALQTIDGVNVSVSGGTVNAGDSFATAVVANADTAGLLSALGLNSFFTGDNAATIQVNPELLNAPASFAASLTGQPGDGTNLQRIIQLNSANLLANGTQTLQQYLGGLVGNVGTQVQDLTEQQTAQQAVRQQLQTQQQSISGVDTNQQLLQLLQFQQSYQMAAHYISVVTTAFQYLLTNL